VHMTADSKMPLPDARPATPELVENPAPSGRHHNFVAYIEDAIRTVGSADALGRMLGFTSGTRLSDWKAARGGRPSVSSCLKLAKITGDDPIDILTMAGHAEEAGLLQEFLKNKPGAPVALMIQPEMALLTAEEAVAVALKALRAAKDGGS
jgi:hypothetical protein